ncbi:hypothetical protein G7Y79_00008g024200 [Physcia stellaris]|nr:hypothetical protein G7Y79_00008g024200 [Physcia stellaris]
MTKAEFRSPRTGKKGGNPAARPQVPRLSRKRDIFLAFTIVSLPLLVIAILLLAFVFRAEREIPDNDTDNLELPVNNSLSSDAFYTRKDIGDFLLVGSWASNFATLTIAPFMLLFSYAVAREVALQSDKNHENPSTGLPLLQEILRGLRWAYGIGWLRKRTRETKHSKPLYEQSTLQLWAYNWLHIATETIDITHYNYTTNYTDNGKQDDDVYQGGFNTISQCDHMLSTPLPQNISNAPLPCSLSNASGLDNVADPSHVYLILGTGISQLSSNFETIDFPSLQTSEIRNTAADFQIVTYTNGGISYSFYFYPDAAQEFDASDHGLGPNFGIDYVAKTTAMSTSCTFATEKCNIRPAPSSANNISLLYSCYPDFTGNLGRTPDTGHERAQGWNMSFYTLDPSSQTPANIPLQAQSNPFHFYVVAAVDSISYPNLQNNIPSKDYPNFVNASLGFTAFALDCEATIHDINFTLIDGSFYNFSATPSSPAKASIIQAPLQAGFGQYRLYQAASLAVIATNDSVTDTMGKAFSQTGMALASGAFYRDYNTRQRFRWTVTVTKVPKAPYFYLVVVCFVYAGLGMVMTGVAVALRRKPHVKQLQARLVTAWGADSWEERRGERRDSDDEDGSGFLT